MCVYSMDGETTDACRISSDGPSPSESKSPVTAPSVYCHSACTETFHTITHYSRSAKDTRPTRDSLTSVANGERSRSHTKRSIQVELGKVEGFTATANADQVFEGLATSSLPTDTAGTNQPVPSSVS
ncbi:hypothetical protein DPX16_13692 [Anabarilius grahami]|uniref:Uncharacterized protein n=1 Tax=Anabarilius grahami TaxID=495550 RepID=A0A3N0XRR2_ANAGA|nr:hypothetical protein DPX16_13692 [Anabarilius grahami]